MQDHHQIGRDHWKGRSDADSNRADWVVLWRYAEPANNPKSGYQSR